MTMKRPPKVVAENEEAEKPRVRVKTVVRKVVP